MPPSVQLPSLSKDTINPHVKAAEYAVRGNLSLRAETYRQQIAQLSVIQNAIKLPFNEVVFANIGNPQQLDQKPITFIRQVLSVIEYPQLLQEPEDLLAQFGYKYDTIIRAKRLLKEIRSVGAYSESQGVVYIRQKVAEFIKERDGYEADPFAIFLTSGATAGIALMLQIICSTSKTGVLIPIPHYPLYKAVVTLLDASPVPYFLDEERGWAIDAESIHQAIDDAKASGIDVRCICVINPGNPTGAVLTEPNIRSIFEIAVDKKLVVLADEVYQNNVFSGSFISFRRVVRDWQKMKPGTFDGVKLVSLHSILKGATGEGGHRGGYFELVGFPSDAVEQIYKLCSISICPPVSGQCVLEMMLNPPKKSEESYEEYRKEQDIIFQNMEGRASVLFASLNKMERVSRQKPQGVMYLYPSITLPIAAIKAAQREGLEPDEFYCLRLLDATGVCVVPGSGFGQKCGTFHFRITFLAPGADWIDRVVHFHAKFMRDFREEV